MVSVNKRTPWMALALIVAGFGASVVFFMVLLPIVSGSLFSQFSGPGAVQPSQDMLLNLFIKMFLISMAGIIPIFAAFSYYLHWFFKTGKELAIELDDKYRSDIWMFLGIIFSLPLAYVYYKVSKLASDYTETGAFVKYLLSLMFLGPIGIFLIQMDINKKTPFEGVKKEPSYDILTRFGLFSMEYWWLLVPTLFYFVLFAIGMGNMSNMMDQLALQGSFQ